MSNPRTRSLQDLVQKMMEVNTRLGEENPSAAQPDGLESLGDSEKRPVIPKKPVAVEVPVITNDEPEKPNFGLEFDQANLVRGIIFTEILGRPKARRGRW